jgi:hypothetical protein
MKADVAAAVLPVAMPALREMMDKIAAQGVLVFV